jgi:hypothetical protein
MKTEVICYLFCTDDDGEPVHGPSWRIHAHRETGGDWQGTIAPIVGEYRPLEPGELGRVLAPLLPEEERTP